MEMQVIYIFYLEMQVPFCLRIE